MGAMVKIMLGICQPTCLVSINVAQTGGIPGMASRCLCAVLQSSSINVAGVTSVVIFPTFKVAPNKI